MMVATATDFEIGCKVAVENHVPAIGTFVPKIIWGVPLFENIRNLWADNIINPVHLRLLDTQIQRKLVLFDNLYCAATRAPRTPSLSSRTKPRTSSTKPAFGAPVSSN